MKELIAGHVSGIFELPGVDAQITVRRIKNSLQISEAQGFVDRQGTHDSQA